MGEGSLGKAMAVNPEMVPKKRLRSGAAMPAIGLGTFGSDAFSAKQIAAAVTAAAGLGYRHFDCASVYGNEKWIGEALRGITSGGIPREHLWVTSKLWNDSHDDVRSSCERTLADLQLDYLDLYLVHWPFTHYHPPGCEVTSRSCNAGPYQHERYMKTWCQMERLVARGMVRHIGTSNMTIPKLELLLGDCSVAPAVNQMEIHPHFQQPELFDYLVSRDVVPVGFCPMGSPNRPARDRTAADASPLEDLVLLEIAKRYGSHPAEICIRWATARGHVPIPFSVKREQLLANLKATTSRPLSSQEMAALGSVGRNCRLIKGQVFLWRDDQDWRALWDEDGEIAP